MVDEPISLLGDLDVRFFREAMCLGWGRTGNLPGSFLVVTVVSTVLEISTIPLRLMDSFEFSTSISFRLGAAVLLGTAL